MKKSSLRLFLTALCAAIAVLFTGAAVMLNTAVAQADETTTDVYCTVSNGTNTYTFGKSATDSSTNYFYADSFLSAVEAAYKKIDAVGYTLKVGAEMYFTDGEMEIYLHDSFFNPDASTNGTEYNFTLDLNGNTLMEMNKKDDSVSTSGSPTDNNSVVITVIDSAPFDATISASPIDITADGLYFVYVNHNLLTYKIYDYYDVKNIGTTKNDDSVVEVKYTDGSGNAQTEYFNAANASSFVNGETEAEIAQYILDSKIAALRVGVQTVKKFGTAAHPATINLLCDILGFYGEEQLTFNDASYVTFNLGPYWIKCAKATGTDFSNENITVCRGSHLTVTATTGGIVSSELDCFQVNFGLDTDIDSYLTVLGGTYSARGHTKNGTDNETGRIFSLNSRAHVVVGNNTVTENGQSVTYKVYMQYLAELKSGNAYYTVSKLRLHDIFGVFKTGAGDNQKSSDIVINGGEFAANRYVCSIGTNSTRTSSLTINGGNYDLAAGAAICTKGNDGVILSTVELVGGTFNTSVDDYCDVVLGNRGYHSVYIESVPGDSSTGYYSVTLGYEAHITKTLISDGTSTSVYYSTFALAMNYLTNTEGYTTVIYLDNDLTFSSAIAVDGGLDFTINFNGYFISSSLVDGPFDLTAGSVMFAGSNGGIKYTGSESVYYAVRAGGADVKILGGFYYGKIDELKDAQNVSLSAVVLQGGYFAKLNLDGDSLMTPDELTALITSGSGYSVDAVSHSDFYFIVLNASTSYPTILTVNLTGGATCSVIYTVLGVTNRQYVSADATEINLGSYAQGTYIVLMIIPSSGSFTQWNIDGSGGDLRHITVSTSNNLFVTVRKVITITQNAGASVRLSDPIGLRFTASILKSDVNAAFDLNFYDQNNVRRSVAKISFGMMLMPLDYLSSYSFGSLSEVSFLKYYTENQASSAKMIFVKKASMLAKGEDVGTYDIKLALVNIKPKNFDRKFLSVSYMIIIDKVGNSHMVFGIGAENQYTSASGRDYGSMPAKYARDIYGVSTSAYNDRKTETAPQYTFLAQDNNTYSPYTDIQRNSLSLYLDSIIKLDSNYAPLSSGAYATNMGYNISKNGSLYTLTVTNANTMGLMSAKINKIFVDGVDVTSAWTVALDGKSATFSV